MADFNARVLGADLVRERITSLSERCKVGVRHGLNLVSADLLERSANLAPILTGELIRSGRVIARRPSKDVYKSTVAYGTDYAVYMHYGHYNLGPISRTKPPTEDGPVGRMFLARPFWRHRNRYELLIISQAVKGSGTVRVPGVSRGGGLVGDLE